MTTETNTAPVDDEAVATEDLEEPTPKPKPITAPVPPRPGTSPDGNWDPLGNPPKSN